MTKQITIVFLLISSSIFGQEFIFDIHNSSLHECLQIEKELNSNEIETTSNHVSFSGDAQPIKYIRKEMLIPDLTVFYYFQIVDTTISSIKYEWDISNFEKQDNNQKSDEFQDALIAKYKDLKKKISSEYGEPEVKKNYSNISRLDSINTFVESSNWYPNDSTEIEMYATVSNYYEKKGAMTINPVHRIRLYVKKITPKKEPPKLEEERLNEIDIKAKQFFELINNSEFENAKEILANEIKAQASNDVLTQISNSIGNIENFEITASGIQLGIDGTQYSILNYSIVEKLENNLVNNFKIVFNDDKEIVSIK
jgi:hypothetical protein